MKAKEENGTIKIYPNLPTAYGNVLNGYELMIERHEADGFFDVFEPELLANEQNGAIYFDENLKAFTYPIETIIIVEPTAQELYDNLKKEGEAVFENFRNELAKAASPYTILGTVPEELKQLTQIMLDARTRISDGLAYYLAQNDVETLKAFSFQTEEAEQLMQAIQQFK